MLLYSVSKESEPVRTGSSGRFVEKENPMQLLLNRVLSVELKFPTTHLMGPRLCKVPWLPATHTSQLLGLNILKELLIVN